MDYLNYIKLIKDTPEIDGLEYAQTCQWLHPEHIPLGVVSIGDASVPVVRIPRKAVNRYGNLVSVCAIGNSAFRNCTFITDIILHSEINKICSGAFAGCTSLKRITIPKAVKAIKQDTFTNCTSLSDIYYEGSQDDWKRINIEHTHEIVLGKLQSGTPVQIIEKESTTYLPGNEALFTATIHYNCKFI